MISPGCLKERLDAPGSLNGLSHGAVGGADGALRVIGPELVRGRVVLTEVEQDELGIGRLEQVPRNQSAAPVLGALETDLWQHRASRAIELTEVEVVGSIDRMYLVPLRDRGHRAIVVANSVSRATAPDEEIDRGCLAVVILEDLEQRARFSGKMHMVEVDDRVLDRAPGALDRCRGE